MEGTGTSGRPSGPHTHAARTTRTAFHPSVVLLLDDEGERVAAYLSELLAGLPPAVQSWVELLPASEALDPANEAAFESALAAALARVTMVHLRDDVRRAGYQVGDATPLVLLVGHTTSPALLAAALAAQHVTDRGFPQTIRLALLSDSRPHDPDAARALDEQARTQPWDRLLGWFAPGAAEAEPPVALCLLYQDYDERSWHWNLQEADVARLAGPGKFSGSRVTTGPLRGRTTGPLAADVAWAASSTTGPLGRSTSTGPLGRSGTTGPLRAGAVQAGGPSGPLASAPDDASPLPAFEPEDVRYAVAEAAFALIASGLVDEPEFREQVRLNMPTAPGGGGEAERRFATLATSRLAFPRAHAEAACGQYEGAALLADWLRAIEREAPRATTRRNHGRRAASNLTRGEDATRFLRALRGEIEDSEELAFRRVGESSPPLSAEGISQLYGFERTEIDPARIFAPFRGGSIAREMAATGERVPGALRSLDERALVRFRRWRQDASQVWGEVFAEREHEVAEHVEATLLATPAGIGLARGYLSELRQKLTWMRERQDDRERHRAAAFERYLRTLAFEANDIKGAVRGARVYASTAANGPVASPQTASASATSTLHAATTPLPSDTVPNEITVTPPTVIPEPARPAQASAWLNDAVAPALPETSPFGPAARGASLEERPGVDSDTLARQALIASALVNATTRPLYAPDIPEDVAGGAPAAHPLTITGALPVIATGLSALPAQDAAAGDADSVSHAASAAATDALDASSASVAAETEADPIIMPDRLQQLIAQLGAQLGTEDGLLPSYGTVLAALLMLLPFLAYAAVALAPVLPWRLPVWRIGASHLPLNVVVVGIVLALAVGVPTVMIYRQQAERVGRLRRLLVGAYVRWWAELCGRAEDTLRREGVQQLRAVVEERLAAVAGFEERLRQAQGELSAGAARMESALTAGPQGRRDVFVVGGKRFPGVRMVHLHQRVQARRAGDPLEPGHVDELALGAALRGRLRTEDAGLLDLSSEEIAGRVAEFGTEVCRPYLAGELVTVLPAIHLGWDDNDTDRVPLGTLIERATPLYRPIATDSPRRLVALAAPEELALRDAPAAAPTLRLVTTPSPEWLLVAHLLSHGRPRWWRRALIEPRYTGANGTAHPAGAVAANGLGRGPQTGGNA